MSPSNPRATTHRLLWPALVALAASLTCAAQELVVSTGADANLGGPGPMVVFGDVAAEWDALVPYYIAPTAPHSINAHDIVLLSRDLALTPGVAKPWVDLIDIPTGTSAGFFQPGGAGDTSYTGYGTAALNPAATHLLLASGAVFVAADRSKVWVVPLPLSNLSVASHVLTLPGTLGTAQTHAIVFDPDNGRAYIGHSNGITAVDPPYANANIVFTLPLAAVTDPNNAVGRALALSPDKQVLLSTAGLAGRPATIVHAPFSATSVTENIMPAGADTLDAAVFLPDGSKVLVVDSRLPNDFFTQSQVLTIAAPYSANSTTERLLLPMHLTFNGYEDIAISADGQYVALTGGTSNTDDALLLLHAPYTAAGVTHRAVLLAPVGQPYGGPGRGAGAAEFWSAPASLLPQLTIDRVSVTEGNTGTTSMRFRVSLTRASAQTVSVHYSTSNGTANAGIDYISGTGTLTFSPGTLTRTMNIEAIGNTATQPDRLFRVLLSNPTNALVLQTPDSRDGEGMILDDDNPNVPIVITNPPLPDAVLGMPYTTAPFQSVGLTVTPPNFIRWRMTELYLNPPGLSIGQATGVISGVPTKLGSYYFYVRADGDYPQAAAREYHIVVRAADGGFADGFE